MNGVITSCLTKLESSLELFLITHVEKIVTCPGAPSKPQHKVPLAGHPVVVLGHRSRSGRGVKEQLLVVGKRNVDNCRILADLPQTVPDQDTNLKGILSGEVWQRERLLLSRNLGKLFW